MGMSFIVTATVILLLCDTTIITMISKCDALFFRFFCFIVSMFLVRLRPAILYAYDIVAHHTHKIQIFSIAKSNHLFSSVEHKRIHTRFTNRARSSMKVTIYSRMLNINAYTHGLPTELDHQCAGGPQGGLRIPYPGTHEAPADDFPQSRDEALRLSRARVPHG
jgi:hypothetical protein